MDRNKLDKLPDNVISLSARRNNKNEKRPVDPELFLKAEIMVGKLRHPNQTLKAIRLPLPTDDFVDDFIELIADQFQTKTTKDPRVHALREQLADLNVYVNDDASETCFAYFNRAAKGEQADPCFVAYSDSELLWQDISAQAENYRKPKAEWTALWEQIGQIANSEAFLPPAQK